MVLDPPPSSKRLRRTETEIDVTMHSAAMQETFDRIKTCCERGDGIYMVVHPKDSPEFMGFVHKLCCRLPLAPPHVLRRDETMKLWSLRESDMANGRGIVLLQAEALPNRMVPELERLLTEKKPRRLLVARFASKECLKRAAKNWGRTLHGKFDSTPIAWPNLEKRKDDITGIVDRVCAALVSKDGTRRAVLSADARHVLLRGEHKHVSKLLARIKGAFDVSLSEEASEISIRHLVIADSPESRRMIFSRPAPSSTP
jgi:hypothetical protein